MYQSDIHSYELLPFSVVGLRSTKLYPLVVCMPYYHTERYSNIKCTSLFLNAYIQSITSLVLQM